MSDFTFFVFLTCSYRRNQSPPRTEKGTDFATLGYICLFLKTGKWTTKTQDFEMKGRVFGLSLHEKSGSVLRIGRGAWGGPKKFSRIQVPCSSHFVTSLKFCSLTHRYQFPTLTKL